MLLPRKWALGLGLLAAAPGLVVAGPFDSPSSSAGNAAVAAKRDNDQVAKDVGRVLQQANLTYENVNIKFQNGVCEITGRIQDAQQHALVTKLCSSVPDVKSVENKLQVMQPGTVQPAAAAFPAQTAAAQPAPQRVAPVAFDQPAATNNKEVAQNIAKALQGAGLSKYDIEIRYRDGVASLIGAVSHPTQARQAEAVASRVPGVNQVLNRLQVEGAGGAVQPAAAQGMAGPGGPPQGYAPQGYGQPGYGPPVQQAQAMAPQMAPMPAGPGGPGAPYGNIQPAGHHVYNQPNVPDYAYPGYAQPNNSASITYPSQYDASAWPYIGPYYPYPQVPLGWRKSTLEWDDGYWSLKFDSKTDRWWWFLNPHNWD